MLKKAHQKEKLGKKSQHQGVARGPQDASYHLGYYIFRIWDPYTSSFTTATGGPKYNNPTVTVTATRELQCKSTSLMLHFLMIQKLLSLKIYGCWTNNRGGKPPKMDDENDGKPNGFGGTPIFGNTHMKMLHFT